MTGFFRSKNKRKGRLTMSLVTGTLALGSAGLGLRAKHGTHAISKTAVRRQRTAAGKPKARGIGGNADPVLLRRSGDVSGTGAAKMGTQA
jgi:hypothetical protein